jgi:soluble lytic murein transglycosylase-like protein
MMLDEHLLGFMRGGHENRSLYQRFAQLQWSGPGMIAANTQERIEEKTAENRKGKIAAVAVAPAETPEEEISSVLKLRKKTDRAQAYEPIIRDASKAYGVEPELIRAVIRAESNFRNESTSPKGAMGLMQLMPATAKDLGVRDAYDPRENIMGGTRYLKGLLDRYRGDVPTALAAYNWGMGNVERNPEKLPRETRVYIDRIQRFMDEGKA